MLRLVPVAPPPPSIEEFHSVLETTREKMQGLLAHGPASLDAAMDLAMKAGLLG